MRKFLSLTLVLTMLLVLAACTPKPSATPAPTTAPEKTTAAQATAAPAEPAEPASELEPYALTYYMYSSKVSDQDKVVEEAINKIIQEKFNATVDFIMVAAGDWNEKALIPLRAGEKIDIFWTPEWMHYMANIQYGSLLKLDDPSAPHGDLINTYAPQTVADLGDFIPANRVGGFLYGVPTNKELCVPGGLIWNQTLVEKYGYDIATADTPEKLEAILADFTKTEEYKGGMYPLLSTGNWSAFDPFIQGFMSNMEPISMYIGEPGANDGVPVLVWDSPEQKERVAIMKTWYDAKYLHPDSYLTSFNNIDYLNAGNFLVSTDFVLKGGQVKANELMAQSGNGELKLVEVQTSASVNVTTHAGGSMLGIPVTSKDPARAMMFINEMHQNEDLLNTMAWGVEGVHYNLNAGGFVEPVDMNGWSDSHGGMWTLGNQFKQKLAANEDPEKYKQMMALTAEAWAHESLGFRFDPAGFENEYTAIQNITDTYSRALRCGVNTQDYDKMLAELEAAGLPRVFAAATEQYAQWKASK